MSSSTARKLLLITSKISGTQTDAVSDLRAVLKKAKIPHEVVRIGSPTEIAAVIKKRAHAYQDIAVYGGDGTVVMTIKALAGTQHRLLILPGGTANTVAKELVISNDPTVVLQQYVDDQFRPYYYDVATANGTLFALDMHSGWWTKAIKNTTRDMKKRFSMLAYGITAFKQLPKTKRRTYVFEVDGKLKQKSGYTLLVANHGAQSFFGVNLFPHHHRSGIVQLAVIRRLSLFRLLVWLLGRTVSTRNLGGVISTYRAHTITIKNIDETFIFDDHAKKLKVPLEIKGGYKQTILLVPESTWRMRRNYLQLLCIRLKERLRNALTGQPAYAYTQFAPHLYVGGAYRRRAYEQFRRWGVTGIVNMRSSVPEAAPQGFTILHLKTRDWSAPSLDALKEGVAFIGAHIQAGGGVYIHCRQGEGRGPTMAAAYLISQGVSTGEAIAQMQVGRPQARPNTFQRARLRELEASYRQNPASIDTRS